PEDPSQHVAKLEGNNDLLGLSFPRKLWGIVEDDASMSVHWNDAGDTRIIEKDLFQCEVLYRRGKEQIFESDSLKTFIHPLAIGFSKIHPGNSPGNRMMVYRYSNFQKDKPWLIQNIKTKGNQMNHTWPDTTSTPPQRNKRLPPTRHSAKKALKKLSKRKSHNPQGPSATCSFKFSVLLLMNSAIEVRCESEAGGPSGEGISGNGMLVPLATAGTDGTGALTSSPLNHTLYDLMMYLYNTWY
uniref:HSF-type DNA-binding domain-containing protein n=1 Tax=Myotis lucifugus TaxID=59463 RepID=G1QEM9_MYOLU